MIGPQNLQQGEWSYRHNVRPSCTSVSGLAVPDYQSAYFYVCDLALHYYFVDPMSRAHDNIMVIAAEEEKCLCKGQKFETGRISLKNRTCDFNRGFVLYLQQLASFNPINYHHKLCTMFKIVHNLISFLSILYPALVDTALICIFNHLFTTTASCTDLYLALFLPGTDYQLMHLIYLHLNTQLVD